jgi:hypothetical protein
VGMSICFLQAHWAHWFVLEARQNLNWRLTEKGEIERLARVKRAIAKTKQFSFPIPMDRFYSVLRTTNTVTLLVLELWSIFGGISKRSIPMYATF